MNNYNIHYILKTNNTIKVLTNIWWSSKQSSKTKIENIIDERKLNNNQIKITIILNQIFDRLMSKLFLHNFQTPVSHKNQLFQQSAVNELIKIGPRYNLVRKRNVYFS